MVLRAQANETATGRVRLVDAAASHDDAAGREVGAFDDREQLRNRDLVVVHHETQRRADLAQVVRRQTRRHADRDSVGTVAEQVRETTRQHGRLHATLVVVRLVVDRLLLEVVHHRDRGARHARLRVSHCGRRIAVDRTEVSLAVDERITQREVLRHSHERRIDHRLTVRVVVARRVAGNLRALPVLRTRRQVQVVHRDEDSSLRRLQAVADVGQRPGMDDTECVREVRLLHLLSNAPRLDAVIGSLRAQLVRSTHLRSVVSCCQASQGRDMVVRKARR